MNTLEKLIAKLCPNGVEYKPLGKICVRHHGTNITAGRMAELSCYNGEVRVFAAGSTIADVPGDAIPTDDIIKEVGIIVKSRGYVGFEYYEKPFTHKNELWSYTSGSCDIDLKFVYYYLLTKTLALQALARAKSVKLPQLATGDTDALEIPLPPLPVQKEIVRMLDEMAGLIDALEEELAARKKQYEWYRDSVLHEVTTKEYEYKTVGEIFETITDYTAAGSFAMVAQNVVYKRIPDYAQLIRTTDIKSNFQKEDVVYIDKHAFDFLWRVHLDAESIILPNVGNCGEVYFLDPSMLPYAHCALAPNALLLRSSLMNNKFLSYWLRGPEFQTQLKKIIAPNGQSKFNKTDLRKLKIPLIPSNTQEEIVRMFDDMTALIGALDEGITLRKQQYEYYRDKLLTFKRAG